MPTLPLLSLLLVAALVAVAPQEPHGLPLEGEEAETFLRTARIIRIKPVGIGITRPQKVYLDDGNGVLKAIWKSIDELRPEEVSRSKKGAFQLGFRDSYKYEIAAYELDKLLGLNLVPPTVFRRINGRDGSLQLWVEGAFTEVDRRERNLMPKDSWKWSAQIYKMYLLHQLTYNTDSENVNNILFDPDFRVYAIDHSRSFRVYWELPDEDQLRRISRSALERLRQLDRGTVEEKLGPWLTKNEISALMKRRELVLQHVDNLIANRGETPVFY